MSNMSDLQEKLLGDTVRFQSDSTVANRGTFLGAPKPNKNGLENMSQIRESERNNEAKWKYFKLNIHNRNIKLSENDENNIRYYLYFLLLSSSTSLILLIIPYAFYITKYDIISHLLFTLRFFCLYF